MQLENTEPVRLDALHLHDYLCTLQAAGKSGPWFRLPQVLVDCILSFIDDPDSIGYLLLASKSTFPPTELTFRRLCEYIYPRQTARRQLRLQNWQSWRNMLTLRPRLRTNGIYTLRTLFSKSYSNDAFWEERRYESIEVCTLILVWLVCFNSPSLAPFDR